MESGTHQAFNQGSSNVIIATVVVIVILLCGKNQKNKVALKSTVLSIECLEGCQHLKEWEVNVKVEKCIQ